MSGYTQTTNELLYAYYGAGTVSVPTASPGSSIMIGYPPVIVPGGYMSNNGEHSSSLRLIGGGLAIMTATLPIWQFALYFTTAQPAAYSAAGTAVGTSTAVAPAVTSTGCTFEMEWNIGLRTLGAYGAGVGTNTVTCFGQINIFPSVTGANNYSIPAASSTYAPSLTAWPQDQQVYLWPSLLITGATAGNTCTMEWMKLYGEN